MKNLYVGCRVRVVDDGTLVTGREAIGKEGRIDGPGDMPNFWSVILLDGSEWWIHTECLVPIQDPGHQVISWEEMASLWTPEKVGA